MKRPERNGFQNEKIERARKEFSLIAHVLSPKIIRRLTQSFLNCQGERKAKKQIATSKAGSPGQNRRRVGAGDSTVQRITPPPVQRLPCSPRRASCSGRHRSFLRGRRLIPAPCVQPCLYRDRLRAV